jgi:hypothetical protein
MSNERIIMDNVIGKAAKNVKGHWFQEAYYDGDGNFCGVGHLAKAYAEEHGLDVSEVFGGTFWGEILEIKKVMDKVAGEQYPERALDGDSIVPHFPFFNDHPDTTEDEVIAVMEKAAVRWEERI